MNRTFAPIPRLRSGVDRQYTPVVTRSILPRSVDRSSRFPFTDQGHNAGLCTCNALVSLLTYTRHNLGLPDLGPLSRLFTNYNGMALEASSRKPNRWADGLGLQAILRMAATHGVCIETLWPYNHGIHERPIPVAYEQGNEHRIDLHGYSLMTTQREADGLHYRLSDLKTCIDTGNCFMMAFVIDANGFHIQDGIYVAPKLPLDIRSVNSHAVAVCGYDDASATFLIHNSWDELKHFKIRYEDMRAEIAYDIYTIDSLIDKQ